MLYGIIDIGSITIKIRVYDVEENKVKTLFSKTNTAGLVSYKNDNILTMDGIDILVNTLLDYEKIMNNFSIDNRFYFATASLRNIDNTVDVVKIVKDKTGIDIHILSELDEANLSFEVLKRELEYDDGVLFDVGGGSSELTIFENKIPVQQVSLEFGALIAFDEYVSILLPSKDDAILIEKRTFDEINKNNVIKTEKKYLFAVGDTTIKTIVELLDFLNLKDKDTDYIEVPLLDKLFDELNRNDKETYSKILKVNADRIHTIVTAIIIIKSLAKYFNSEQIKICSANIKEGVLHAILNNKL